MFSPLTCAESIKEAVLSYLSSSLPLANHPDQAELGRRFTEMGRGLFRGPYVEGQPQYDLSDTVSECAAGLGADSRRFLDLAGAAAALERRDFTGGAGDALWRLKEDEWPLEGQQLWTRRLYDHQARSFALAAKGRSFVVATGTGSGKTECYLLPLIYRLATEPPQQRLAPGVRAILLFPMNALVEDQMRRLRTLLLCVNVAGSRPGLLRRPITFGRYTGETPRDNFDPNRRPPATHIKECGEVLTRQEMYAAPPDILVTNFSMLEYALLRPQDHQLFSSPALFKTLVLDEVHTYSGTVGAEVALLLRRLRAFLSTRSTPALVEHQYIGTSATLGNRPEHERQMTEFASSIFGLPSGSVPIVVARPRRAESPHAAAGATLPQARDVAAASNQLVIRLVAGKVCVDDLEPGWEMRMAGGIEEFAVLTDGYWESMDEELADTGRWSDDPEVYSRLLLGKLVSRAPIFTRLQSLVRETADSCPPIDALAHRLFEGAAGSPCPEDVVATEVLLIVAANATVNGRPALAPRYHFFIGEQKDGFLCINPACTSEPPNDGWWSRMFLAHHARCPNCSSPAYRVLVCRKCGFALVEGHRTPTGVTLPDSAPDGEETRSRVLFRPQPDPDAPSSSGLAPAKLCVACGQFFASSEYGERAMEEHAGRCPGPIIAVAERLLEGRPLEECPACEQGWYKGEEVLTGLCVSHYGCAAVVMEEVSRALRAARLPTKIISFSDSRQQAAKLAARLQRTNRDFVFRQLAWQAVSTAERPLTSVELLADLMSVVAPSEPLRRLFSPGPSSVGDESAVRNTVADLLLREVLAPYRSLEAIGLVRIAYDADLLEAATRIQLPGELRALFGEEDTNVALAVLDQGLRFRDCVGSAFRALPITDERLQNWRIYRRFAPGPSAPHEPASDRVLFLRKADSRNRLFNLFSRVAARRGRPLGVTEFNEVVGALWGALLSDRRLSTTGRLLAEQYRPLLLHAKGETGTARVQLNVNALKWAPTEDNQAFRCDRCGQICSFSLRGVCAERDCAGRLHPLAPAELDVQSSPFSHYRRLVARDAVPLRVEEHTAEISPERRIEIEDSFRSEDGGSVDVVSGSTTFELGIDLGTVNSVFMANLPPRLANYRQRAGRAGRARGASPLIVSYVRQRPHDQYFWHDLGGFISGPVPPPKFKLSSEVIILRHAFSVLLAATFSVAEVLAAPGGNLWGPPWGQFCQLIDGLSDEQRRRIERQSRPQLESMLAGLGPNPSARLTPAAVTRGFFTRVKEIRGLVGLDEGAGVIEVLGDHGALPTYSFPIYVDELRLYQQTLLESPRRDLKLTRDRRISLAEYYPGNVITAGGYEIKSSGLWEPNIQSFKFCPTCRAAGPWQRRPCNCNAQPIQMRAIVPQGGYYGELVPENSPPDLDTEEARGTDVQFDPAVGDPPPLVRPSGGAIRVAFYDANEMNLARMRVFSPRIGSTRPLRLYGAREQDRARPWKEHQCLKLAAASDGNIYHLLHEFTTDVISLQFLQNGIGASLLAAAADRPRVFWATLGEALLTAASRYLDIDDVANAELGVTFKSSPSSLGGREIVIYDTAPGGAGFAREIGENLQQVFEAAARILINCDCGDSCYKCLRSYRNQWLHADLDRTAIASAVAAFTSRNWARAAAHAPRVN